jgi:hypothetical protein
MWRSPIRPATMRLAIYGIAEKQQSGRQSPIGYKIATSERRWMGTLLLRLPKRGPRTHLIGG